METAQTGKHRRRLKLAKTESKPKHTLKQRILFTFWWYAVLFVVLTGFLFYLQVLSASKVQRQAMDQWTREVKLPAARGEILDANGSILATNGTVYKVVLLPKQIDENDAERIASELSRLLNVDYEQTLADAKNQTRWERLVKRQIDAPTKEAVEALKLGSGVSISLDTQRYYPMGSLLSQVMGYTDIDSRGLDGLERMFNTELSGTEGAQHIETDSRGNPLPYGSSSVTEPVDGLDLVTTINSVDQRYLEKALAEAVEVNSAKNAQGILMDCRTGAVLAMATMPSADLNDLPRNDENFADLMRNRLVTDVYEPGSTMKILTLAAALDSGEADLQSSYYCSGSYNVNGETVHCWRRAGHGSEDIIKAAENSCNCAFMQMALGMGKEKLYDYLYAFGLGRTVGSDFMGEASGIMMGQKYVTDNDLARIGFGQSIAVTPLQLCTAVSAAVNGGELYAPYLIEKMVDPQGNTVYEADKAPVRRVISEQTSRIVRGILQSVVDNGTGRNCKIEGYSVGGKTGTAQKYDEYHRVKEGSYICSFVGFAPAENPRFVCLILVDEPKVGEIFGSTVAAPFVKSVLEDVLHYSGISPTTDTVTVEVPDVCGMSYAKAKAALEEAGLACSAQSADKVVSQLPAAGEKVPQGSEVLLYTGVIGDIEDGEDDRTLYVKVPDLKGLTPLEVYDGLTAMGLVPEFDTDDPAGKVYKQEFSPGTVVKVGRAIKVYFKLDPPKTEDD